MNIAQSATNIAMYDFRSPLGADSAVIDVLFHDLTSSLAFQRLSDVRFLGAIDYVVVRSPNKFNRRFTRYQHSLGVARLALEYANLVELPTRLRQLCYTAALLHDVGHCPLSHSIEPVFEEEFDFNHHQATADIVTGRAAIGAGIHKALKDNGLDADEVLAVISGDFDPFDGFFGGPINFDTIDGILRARSYAQRRGNEVKPIQVMRSATLRASMHDQAIVDEFWAAKDAVYNVIVRSKIGVLADFVCQKLVRESRTQLKKDDFYGTEQMLFKKVPLLRGSLLQLSSTLHQWDTECVIPYKVRKFFVDPSANFFHRDDWSRYKQTKHQSELTVRRKAIRTFKMMEGLFGTRGFGSSERTHRE